MQHKERTIATYTAEGIRVRDRSLKSIEHLLSLSKVVVKRNARGTIIKAQFRHVNGANPIRVTAHAGTKYSFYVHVGRHGSTARAWQHKDLLSSRDVEILFAPSSIKGEELHRRDRAVRAVFLAVPLSCLAAE